MSPVIARAAKTMRKTTSYFMQSRGQPFLPRGLDQSGSQVVNKGHRQNF